MNRVITPILTTFSFAVLLTLTAFTTKDNPVGVTIPEEITVDNTWTHLTTQDGIEINYKYSDCVFPKFNWQQRWVLLQMVNTTSQTKTVSWDYHLYYNGNCKTCNDPYGEYNRTLVIDGNQTMEAECMLETDRRLTVFVKFNDKPNTEELTQFDLANLTITN